jgi:hypothetical protein
MKILFTLTLWCVSLIVGTGITLQSYWTYMVLAHPTIARDMILRADPSISIGSVTNKVIMGQMTGNRNLEFGVKNILEELVSEEYTLNPYATTKIEVEILYLDVLKTQSNLSVFHKNTEAVVVRMKGKLIKDGKVVKTVIAEESAEEVSMAAVLIDQGGKFNNTNLSTAIKKSCNTLVNKLLK